ncbi:hypothetical protein Pmani_016077 [Petrolisthes manimaculis]|uniref:Uncharacterized protein n=1 Tax=Petrolisthes manimaculis TaxID=1843537 RepID=A0AAE1UAX7_9EUCA|nr:hypothetical protein Pmani_016077 [Petrolisthes manimaculis]
MNEVSGTSDCVSLRPLRQPTPASDTTEGQGKQGQWSGEAGRRGREGRLGDQGKQGEGAGGTGWRGTGNRGECQRELGGRGNGKE